MATEEAEFRVLVEERPFAVREYAGHIEAQTQVETDFSNAGKQAFGRLFKYISGHNTSHHNTSGQNRSDQNKSGQNNSTKIAMTSPVTQIPITQGSSTQGSHTQGSSTEDKHGEKIAMTSPVGQRQINGQWLVSFTMPAGSRLEELPTPQDSSVHLVAVSAQCRAVIRYSGSWSEARFQAHKQRLAHWIQTKGYQATGEASWARYNPPFTLWFLRRNEVLIPIERLSE